MFPQMDPAPIEGILTTAFADDQDLSVGSLGLPYEPMYNSDNVADKISREQLERIIQYDSSGASYVSANNMDSWLSGETINHYISAICHHANAAARRRTFVKGGAPLPYVPLNSFLPSTIATQGATSDKVRRYLAKYNVDGQKILQAEHIFIPIHVRNAHWTLMVISPQLKMIAYLDSYTSLAKPNYYYMDDQVIQSVIDMLEYHGGDRVNLDEWAFYSRMPPKQENMCDCGVFVLAYAEAIAFGHHLSSIDPSRRVEYRVFIASTMLRGGFKGDGARPGINVVRRKTSHYTPTDYKRGSGYSINLKDYATMFPDMKRSPPSLGEQAENDETGATGLDNSMSEKEIKEEPTSDGVFPSLRARVKTGAGRHRRVPDVPRGASSRTPEKAATTVAARPTSDSRSRSIRATPGTRSSRQASTQAIKVEPIIPRHSITGYPTQATNEFLPVGTLIQTSEGVVKVDSTMRIKQRPAAIPRPPDVDTQTFPPEWARALLGRDNLFMSAAGPNTEGDGMRTGVEPRQTGAVDPEPTRPDGRVDIRLITSKTPASREHWANAASPENPERLVEVPNKKRTPDTWEEESTQTRKRPRFGRRV
ncbi:ulp1 protease family protein [Phlyctema vagabunda]|uniref:Ulp1 protease family protein n=1 Tax=Phlyctema vagabunda TaxID=108571 RepID=A0ABR4PVD2_9HELO